MVASSSKYSLVIYGATGFTGKLASQYMLKQYGSTIAWAIAGRSGKKLRELCAELNGVPDVVVADGNDEAALAALAASTDAVAACAGPFSRYGGKLVAACVQAGCGYADITGEIDWVREMIDRYDDEARSTGARIVHLCGNDSVPWDLSVLMVHEKLKDRGDALQSVNVYDEIKTWPSGGTIETSFGILFGSNTKKKRRFSFDPLLKKRGVKSTVRTTVANVGALEVSSNSRFKARSFFVMAGVNANAIKRSNALLNYGDITYSEGLGFYSFLGATLFLAQMALFGMLIAFPPTRFFMRKFVLPKPGEGPSEEFMATGYLKVTTVARGHRGTVAKSLMTFSVDPGYKDTARMVVESALALAIDKDKLAHVQGGVYTPAACQGRVLLDRLCKTGTNFVFVDES